ncbi:MAG: GAF domain-containing protein [Dehalococcoidales bacterium]|nr:GAF domain-containing protein [Dehalococcoidales bacterium]
MGIGEILPRLTRDAPAKDRIYPPQKNIAVDDHRIPPTPQLTGILERAINAAKVILNAEASSILLFRDNDQDLFFEAVSGPGARTLKQVRINSQCGIAGQVARTGKPLIVNDVTRSENFHKAIDIRTGFTTKSLICAPLIANERILGVIEILNKLDGGGFNGKDLEVTTSIADLTAQALENAHLYQDILSTFRASLVAIVSAVDARLPSRRGHSQRVMEYVVRTIPYIPLGAGERQSLEYASLLHDIGKIAFDGRAGDDAGPHHPQAGDVMREHPVYGAAMLGEIPFFARAAELILHHHERYDGQGYPHRLKGEEIPFGARLIAVANAFDVMTTAHHPPMSVEQSLKELADRSGTEFCPVAVKAFTYGLNASTSLPS